MSPGGSGGQPLAELVVQFVQKGQEEIQKSVEQVQGQIQSFAAVVADLGNKMTASMTQLGAKIGGLSVAVDGLGKQIASGMTQAAAKTKESAAAASSLGEAFARAGSAINLALGAGAAVVGNFVRQGLSASAMGQVFSFQMEQLSRVIAGLFRPELERVLDGIGRLTNWIRGLTDAQKANISRWIEGGAAALAVGVVLPRIASGFAAITAAVKGLSAVLAGGGLLGGFGALVPLLGLVAQGMAAILVGTQSGRTTLAGMGETAAGLGSSLRELMASLARLGEALAPVVNLVVETVTPAINALAAAIKSLSSDVLLNVVKWGAAIGTFATVLGIIPRVVAAIRSVIAAVRSLNVAQTIFLALQGPKGWAQLAAGAAAAGAALAVYQGIEKSAGQLKDKAAKGAAGAAKKSNFGELERATGGFEDLQSTYKRIAQASIRATAGGKDKQQEVIDRLDSIDRHLGNIDGHTDRTARNPQIRE